MAALEAAKATQKAAESRTFTVTDMVELGLSGGAGAQAKRDWLARRLELGQANGKQFLRRLNDYGISRPAFLAAFEELENGMGKSGDNIE